MRVRKWPDSAYDAATARATDAWDADLYWVSIDQLVDQGELGLREADYDLFLNVEASCGSDGTPDVEMLRPRFEEEVLAEVVGKAVREGVGIPAHAIQQLVDERIARALRQHANVLRVVETFYKASGERVQIVPTSRLLFSPNSSPKPQPLRGAELLREIVGQSERLGFTYAELAAKQQGTRTSNELKRARALLVHRLHERGATLEEIGTWLGGRKRQSVQTLERLGRGVQAEIDADRDANYRDFDPEEAKKTRPWEATTDQGKETRDGN